MSKCHLKKYFGKKKSQKKITKYFRKMKKIIWSKCILAKMSNILAKMSQKIY